MISNLVKRATLFAGLTEDEQAVIVQHMRLQHFAAHEVIYAEDAPSTAIYLIERGGVRLSVGPISLATLGAGATFGESGVFLGRRRAVSVEATSGTDVWALSRDDLEQIVQEHPGIGIAFSRNFGSRIIQVEKYLINQRLRGAEMLRGLTDEELQVLAAHLDLEDFIAGQAIYRAGDANRGFFILENGEVTLQRDGRTQSLKPGDVFGLAAALSDDAYEETAVARSDVIAWELSKQAMEEIVAAHPEFLAHLGAGVHAALPASEEALAVERLRALPLFSKLDDGTLQAIAKRLVVRHVAAGDIVYKEGDIGDALYLVDKGRIEIVGSISRKGQVLARLNAGGFFGEMALLTGKARSTGARAAENTLLWALYRSDFEDLVATYPAIGKALSEVLQDRLGKAGHDFIEKHLRLVALFSGLSVEQLEDVAERLLPARYRGGEIIYKAGSAAERIHIIERGVVELRGPEGVLTLKDGDFFGEDAILTNEPHLDTAFAKTDGEFWELTREDLEALILKYPIVGLNMSRELSRKLHKLAEQKATGVRPAPVPVPAAAPTRAVAPVAPSPVAPAQPTASKPGAFDSLALWFGGLSTGAKWRLALIILLLVWLLGVAIPAMVVNALHSSEAQTASDGAAPRVAVAADEGAAPVAMALARREATYTAVPTATYTPFPTNTPIPTDTPTVTPTSTNTPTPTPTDTPTPTPTNTPLPTPTPRPVVRAAAAAPAKPTATPKPAKQYTLIEVRRLNPCENRGKHNIYVKVVDANGNGVNGLWVIQAVAGNPGAILAKKRTEHKDYWLMNPEDGRVTFDMFKHGRYVVYLSDDGVNPASTDITQAMDSAFTDEANCADGGGGNTLFHNSFSVIFRKNW